MTVTTPLRPGLPPGIPAALERLPRDPKGYPVPWFVAWPEGKPDFRILDPRKLHAALLAPICWLCGEHLSGELTFVIGPMCAINRVSSEPPSHPACAGWAVRACPFLSMPKALRREARLPTRIAPPAGVGLTRNPGVSLLWTCLAYHTVHDQQGGTLFRVGAAVRLEWLAEGRVATRAEVLESIESGLPLLRAPARKEGPRAERALEEMLQTALQLVPAA